MSTEHAPTNELTDTHTRPLDRHLIALEKARRAYGYGYMGAKEFAREVMAHLEPVLHAALKSRGENER